MDDWRDGIGGLRRAGFRVLALTPAADAVPIGDVQASAAQASAAQASAAQASAAQGGDARAGDVRAGGRIALLLGTEGDGLSARWLAAADARVRIPMSGGVDSLNVASAAAIACYLLGPGNRAAGGQGTGVIARVTCGTDTRGSPADDPPA